MQPLSRCSLSLRHSPDASFPSSLSVSRAQDTLLSPSPFSLPRAVSRPRVSRAMYARSFQVAQACTRVLGALKATVHRGSQTRKMSFLNYFNGLSLVYAFTIKNKLFIRNKCLCSKIKDREILRQLRRSVTKSLDVSFLLKIHKKIKFQVIYRHSVIKVRAWMMYFARIL